MVLGGGESFDIYISFYFLWVRGIMLMEARTIEEERRRIEEKRERKMVKKMKS